MNTPKKSPKKQTAPISPMFNPMTSEQIEMQDKDNEPRPVSKQLYVGSPVCLSNKFPTRLLQCEINHVIQIGDQKGGTMNLDGQCAAYNTKMSFFYGGGDMLAGGVFKNISDLITELIKDEKAKVLIISPHGVGRAPLTVAVHLLATSTSNETVDQVKDQMKAAMAKIDRDWTWAINFSQHYEALLKLIQATRTLDMNAIRSDPKHQEAYVKFQEEAQKAAIAQNALVQFGAHQEAKKQEEEAKTNPH